MLLFPTIRKEQLPALLWLHTRLSMGRILGKSCQLFGIPSPLLSFSKEPFFTRLVVAASALPAKMATAKAAAPKAHKRAANTARLGRGLPFAWHCSIGEVFIPLLLCN